MDRIKIARKLLRLADVVLHPGPFDLRVKGKEITVERTDTLKGRDVKEVKRLQRQAIKIVDKTSKKISDALNREGVDNEIERRYHYQDYASDKMYYRRVVRVKRTDSTERELANLAMRATT